jgi:hypothetical protein
MREQLTYHVMSTTGGWVVRRNASGAVGSYHDSRAAAERAARFRAEMDGAAVQVHEPATF